MGIPESRLESARLPWDSRGFCSDADAQRDDLPLYHDAALEAWELEHQSPWTLMSFAELHARLMSAAECYPLLRWS
jgi:hypothetical protein